jgi:hypothetical protein
VFEPRPGEQPQPWDTAKVAAAFADARQLVEALADDANGDAYREALEEVVTRNFDDAASMAEFRDRFAYFVYGLTLFGMGALGVAEADGGLSRPDALAKIGTGLDKWLS